ncbi:MAG: electron transfer flavoprotein subunit beta/FixA family protein [Nitrospinota bacterium]|nr:electron transfer flavoprotein subunit beta/FixA family protein [Nitrospinota bacterium]
MGLNILVTVKQVPDTHNIKGDTMKEDGTVNRAALNAIFNPEDMNALEEGLKIKETLGGRLSVLTMGPPRAVEVLKDSIFRGADEGVLLSDKRFAGADTLATSYALQAAIRKMGQFDIILSGRQAIDGDTAQVGPQIAEKLGLNQLTFVSEVVEVTNSFITVKRSIENGIEIVKAGYPVLLTVTDEANEPRPASVKKVMAYKNLTTKKDPSPAPAVNDKGVITHIKEWDADTIGADVSLCGLSGSPTKVKEIESVVLTAGDTKMVGADKEAIDALIHELTEEYIIG